MTDILLVEDNELNRDMLTRRLNRKGFDVRTAADGQQALDEIDRQTPDLVLLDMDLPILNGWETSATIRKNTALANLPIIALTAHAMTGDKQKALEAGCNDYATKPVDFPNLLEKINQLLGDR